MNREAIGSIFTTWAENYAKNYHDGENLRVVPARLKYNENGEKGEAKGVVVFVNNKVTLAITAEHALKLSDGIHDALNEADA